MQILTHGHASYEVWPAHATLMRHTPLWGRGDPELRELAHGMVRDSHNRRTMAELVSAGMADGVTDDVIADRFACSVGHGQLVMRSVRAPLRATADPYTETARLHELTGC